MGLSSKKRAKLGFSSLSSVFFQINDEQFTETFVDI